MRFHLVCFCLSGWLDLNCYCCLSNNKNKTPPLFFGGVFSRLDFHMLLFVFFFEGAAPAQALKLVCSWFFFYLLCNPYWRFKVAQSFVEHYSTYFLHAICITFSSRFRLLPFLSLFLFLFFSPSLSGKMSAWAARRWRWKKRRRRRRMRRKKKGESSHMSMYIPTHTHNSLT